MDHWVALLLAPLALWVLLSGLDDCVIDAAAAVAWLRVTLRYGGPENAAPDEQDLANAPPRLTAIFVAVWKEHRVIQGMIDNNVTRVNYPRLHFFVGAYPNDGPTLGAIREAMKRHPNVHLAVCPHDGPTSKADCLNWIYQRMILYEEEHGERFEMVLTHDAEDIIDPDAVLWINYYGQWHDMIQIPVLPLPTPLAEITHGVYCDEFSEYQQKDMMGRSLLGGFIPSSGVGTGFSRRALEALAAAHRNRIFEPGCLTEDYENGFRVASLGLRQKFIPIHVRSGRPIATRGYFPRCFQTAVRQRARWITGIGLQSWEYHSFGQTLRHSYWFWRDRKSLVGNIAGPLTNLVFFYGAVTWGWALAMHRVWGLPIALENESHWLASGSAAGLSLQIAHTAIRVGCSARVYGWPFAAGVPVRVVAGNWINCVATCRAIGGYTAAKLQGRPLRWAKTEHSYPNRAALLTHRRLLGEILGIPLIELEAALLSCPPRRRLGEHLVLLGLATEEELYKALGVQNNLPFGRPEAALVSLAVTRSLPAAVARKWHVLPFRIAGGELYLAGSELPGDEMQKDVRRFSSLEIRFQLVTPTQFEEMAGIYLG